jgi:hypothetical protein
MVSAFSRIARILVAVVMLPAVARAQPVGPLALVVNSDDPAFSWQRVQRTMAEALGTAIVATDEPAATNRRGLLTVSWRPSRRELAVTYEDSRGVISRSVEAPGDVTAGVAAAAFLAVNLERDQAGDLLGTTAHPDAVPPEPVAPAAPPPHPEPRLVIEGEPPPAPALPPTRPRERWTVGMVAGLGAGWASGTGNVNADAVASPGMAPSGLAHLTPEVGFYVDPRLLLSISARLEFLTGTNDLHLPMDPAYKNECGGDFVCDGPKFGLAGFARATLFGAHESSDLRAYVSFAVGVGQILYPVTFSSIRACGPSGNAVCVDTITKGPLFAGPGGGLRYRLAGRLDLVAGVEILLGGPQFTVNGDLNAGAAVSF